MQASVSEFDFLKRDLSGFSNDREVEGEEREASDLSDPRLGFSSFAAVKRRRRDSLITTYRVATLPLSRSLALRAATLSRFLSTRTLPTRWGFQQLVVIKVTLFKLGQQQLFSLTPSELVLFFFFRHRAICYTPAARRASASVEFSLAKEVAQ